MFNVNPPEPPLKLIQLDDEVQLRITFKSILKQEGIGGLLAALRMVNAVFIIGLDVWKEYTVGERL